MKKILVIVLRKLLNFLESRDNDTHDIINYDKSNCDTQVNNDGVESNICQPNYCNHEIFEKIYVTLKFSNPVNIVKGYMQLFCVA